LIARLMARELSTSEWQALSADERETRYSASAVLKAAHIGPKAAGMALTT
jgi:hypothetical protein